MRYTKKEIMTRNVFVIIIMLIIILFIASCSQLPIKTISNQTLRYRLKQQFPNADIKLADSDYAIPTKNWITFKFSQYYIGTLGNLGIHAYSKDFDCDNYSLLYKSLADVKHAKEETDIDGFAVGEVWNNTHAFNIVVDKDYKFYFIEPQNQKEIKNVKDINIRNIRF